MKMVKKAVCKNCGVSFYSKFCISLHEYFHKKKSITTAGLYCDICGKRYNSAKIFENHLPHHGFCCFKDNCDHSVKSYCPIIALNSSLVKRTQPHKERVPKEYGGSRVRDRKSTTVHFKQNSWRQRSSSRYTRHNPESKMIKKRLKTSLSRKHFVANEKRHSVVRPDETINHVSWSEKYSSHFDLAESVKTHSNNTEERSFTCKTCKGDLKSNIDLMKHQMVHKSVTNSQVKFSNACSSQSDMTENIKTQSINGQSINPNEASFTCEACGVVFRSMANLITHQLVHNTVTNNHVRSGERYGSRSHLAEHVKAQSGGSNKYLFPCEACGISFNSFVHLVEHKVLHITTAVKCFTCGKVFSSVLNLTEHAKSHCGRTYAFHCVNCGKTFVSQSQLTEHLSLHRSGGNEKTFTYEMQGNVFKTNYDLTTRQIVQKAATFNCLKCGNTYDTQSDLTEHVREHYDCPEITSFSCKICEEVFESVVDLMKHHLIHKTPPFNCFKCEDAFATQSQFIEHIKTHDDKLITLTCFVCGKTFQYKRNLELHLLTHLGEKSFSCDICDKKFAFSRSAIQHRRMHMKLNKKNFSCGFCKEKFSSKSDLHAHFNNHSSELPFACEICGKRFKGKMNRDAHVKWHVDEKTFECKICKKLFARECSLAGHLQNHMETTKKILCCDFCNGKFPYVSKLIAHLRGVHSVDTPFSCDICDNRFKTKLGLKRHMSVHVREKPIELNFSCETCQKSFTSNFELIKHLVVHISKAKVLNSDESGGTFDRIPYLKEHVKNLGDDANLVCDRCGEKFKYKKGFQAHQLLHFTLNTSLFDQSKASALKTDTAALTVKQKKEKHFRCDICGRMFNALHTFQLHLCKSHSNEIRYKCVPCQLGFRWKISYERHIQKHSGNKTFSCMICKKRFYIEFDLKEHLRNHKTGNSFSCDRCGKVFVHKYKLSTHLKTHMGLRPFSCETCGKTFRQKYGLDKHLLVHTGEKPFPCGICGQTFRQKHNLGYHLLRHSGEKPFSCKICGKLFRGKQSLKTHEKSHDDEMPYKCEYCQKGYNWKSSYEIHVRGHTGHKPFSCTTCKKRFKCRPKLKQHLRVHTGERPFTCETCGKKFSSQSSMKRHSEMHLNPSETLVCEICQKTFRQKQSLTKHINMHLSDKETITSPKLCPRIVGARPFACEICEKLFTLKRNLNRHLSTAHSDISRKKSSL